MPKSGALRQTELEMENQWFPNKMISITRRYVIQMADFLNLISVVRLLDANSQINRNVT